MEALFNRHSKRRTGLRIGKKLLRDQNLGQTRILKAPKRGQAISGYSGKRRDFISTK